MYDFKKVRTYIKFHSAAKKYAKLPVFGAGRSDPGSTLGGDFFPAIFIVCYFVNNKQQMHNKLKGKSLPKAIFRGNHFVKLEHIHR